MKFSVRAGYDIRCNPVNYIKVNGKVGETQILEIGAI